MIRREKEKRGKRQSNIVGVTFVIFKKSVWEEMNIGTFFGKKITLGAFIRKSPFYFLL